MGQVFSLGQRDLSIGCQDRAPWPIPFQKPKPVGWTLAGSPCSAFSQTERIAVQEPAGGIGHLPGDGDGPRIGPGLSCQGITRTGTESSREEEKRSWARGGDNEGGF